MCVESYFTFTHYLEYSKLKITLNNESYEIGRESTSNCSEAKINHDFFLMIKLSIN